MKGKLMESIWQGDQKAWEAYFKENYPLFLAFAHSLVNDKDVAVAVVTKVFIKLWEKRASFNTPADMKYKFYSEIRFRSIDYFEEKVPGRELAVPGNEIESFNISEEDQFNKYREEKLYNKLYAEIDLLPKRCRQVMILRFKEGLQVKEIADKLGIRHNTVSTQIKIGLEELRRSLLEQLKRVKDNPGLADIELLLMYTLLYVESTLFSVF